MRGEFARGAPRPRRRKAAVPRRPSSTHGIARLCRVSKARACAPAPRVAHFQQMPEDADHDVVYLHSPTEDGDGVRVVRARQGKVEVGEVRPLAEGKPVSGEIVTLRPRDGVPRVCDVKVEYAPAEERGEA